MATDTNNQKTHLALFPFLAQGHMIPMMDIATTLAQRGHIVTVFTTQANADRFKTGLDRAIHSGSQIRLAYLRFPSVQVGLPEGCENLDMLPDKTVTKNFFQGADMLHRPAEELFRQLHPRPCCVISDMCFPWTLDIANKFHIPRITFSGFSSFFLACVLKLLDSDVLDTPDSDYQYFSVPGLPDRVEFTRDQMSVVQRMKTMDILVKIVAADKASYGAIVNSFQELEPGYADEYKKARGGKAWFIGPVSLSNNKPHRGNKPAIDARECLNWLDSWPRASVVYACMGSMHNLAPAQMMELGLGLEASNSPFIWVMRGGEKIEEGFEERVKGRGLLIRGWAPQVVILSHPSVGAFLTHCGWNSTLEGVCAGLPLITWPLFGDQFGNQKLVEQVLRIGVGVGAEVYMRSGEEEKIGVVVKREDVKRAIERVMDGGEEGEERRNRVRELGGLGKRAVEEGGSSHDDLSKLIEDIIRQSNSHV